MNLPPKHPTTTPTSTTTKTKLTNKNIIATRSTWIETTKKTKTNKQYTTWAATTKKPWQIDHIVFVGSFEKAWRTPICDVYWELLLERPKLGNTSPHTHTQTFAHFHTQVRKLLCPSMCLTKTFPFEHNPAHATRNKIVCRVYEMKAIWVFEMDVWQTKHKTLLKGSEEEKEEEFWNDVVYVFGFVCYLFLEHRQKVNNNKTWWLLLLAVGSFAPPPNPTLQNLKNKNRNTYWAKRHNQVRTKKQPKHQPIQRK